MPNNSAAPLQVAKFGGTSVADFDAMNRSADIVLANPAVRLVVLYRLGRRHQCAGCAVGR